MNRGAHKGTKVVSDLAGNAGKTFRCPTTRGRTGPTVVDQYPLKGLRRYSVKRDGWGCAVRNVETYRGFVFARLSEQGIGFRDYFGDSLPRSTISPTARPRASSELAGGCLRFLHNCNWKMFVENLNDTMHLDDRARLLRGASRELWEGQPADRPKRWRSSRSHRSRATTSSSTTWACACTRMGMVSPASISPSIRHTRACRSTRRR